ncbi:hypothetical protein LPJ61_003693 [Coemansia biformis]|uniref:F-box domain-containing protein n=1 Tax=Coemansia biformis TaxID=1286918 RepID=A0A9W7Y650_9FUNG|nr:hypothetical protein LPJ61_003693 [Coemansia biformis]
MDLISDKEWAEAVKQSPRGKVPGRSGVTFVLVRALGPHMLRWLQGLCDAALWGEGDSLSLLAWLLVYDTLLMAANRQFVMHTLTARSRRGLQEVADFVAGWFAMVGVRANPTKTEHVSYSSRAGPDEPALTWIDAMGVREEITQRPAAGVPVRILGQRLIADGTVEQMVADTREFVEEMVDSLSRRRLTDRICRLYCRTVVLPVLVYPAAGAAAAEQGGAGHPEASSGPQDLVTRLPFDLAILVAEHLSPKDLYNCWLVCRGWNRLFTSDSILHPVFVQLSHFDQESFMFQCLPTGHDHGDDEKATSDAGASVGPHDSKADSSADAPAGTADIERTKLEEMRIEERASQQWLKNSRVLVRVMQNLLNRAQHWKEARPTTRIYLPPVPLDGTDSDIREEWQGPVKLVKMKAGMIAVLHKQGRSIRLWSLESGYDRVREMTKEYIAANRKALEEQTKHGGPHLPAFSNEQVETLLKHSRSGMPRGATLKSVTMRVQPAYFDFFESNKTLVTATCDGVVDVYDMECGAHKRTLKISSDDNIESIHVWLDYVVVSHGTRITLWNHTTGELLEDALETAHRAEITGVFILDNDRHLLSIDKKGILVATNRDAEDPRSDTLMDVPLYPVVLAGQMGAPYSMRLLHMTHLCVWGKFSLGHYEMYEPGLRSLPPLSSLILSAPGEEPRRADAARQPGAPAGATDAAPPEGEGDGLGRAASSDVSAPAEESSVRAARPSQRFKSEDERQLSDAREALAQLETAHESLEQMYSQMAGDRDDEHPDGERLARFRRNRVPAEQRYHVLNIDTPFEHISDGQVLSVDFKHALFQRTNFMQISDLESRAGLGMEPSGMSLGLFPVDPLPVQFGPDAPPAPHTGPAPPRAGWYQRDTEGHSGEDDNGSDDDNDYEDDDDYYEEYEDYGGAPEDYWGAPEGYGGEHDDDFEDLEGTGEGDADDEFYFEWAVNEEFARMDTTTQSRVFGGRAPGAAAEEPQRQDAQQTEDESPQCTKPDISKASLLQLEGLVMRYILGLRFALEDPGFGRVALNRMHLENGREFMAKYMPELLDAVNSNAGIEEVAGAAPCYIQRAYEARFAMPTLNVNHHGQSVPAQRLFRDMDRIYRAARVPGSSHPPASAGLVPPAVADLTYASAAMDDSRIAIGCQNGYVVITTFD